MKKKKKSTIGILFILVIVCIIMVYFYMNQRGSNASEAISSSSTSTIKEIEVGRQTITKTLTSSGEILSAQEETLNFDTSKYFSQVCVEENQEVAVGENILQYTDGTYFTAPYNLVISKLIVPEEGYLCSSKYSVSVKSTDSLALSISIDETQMSSVSVGQEVTIVPSADETKNYTGVIRKINPIGTYSSSGSKFTGNITFTNDGKLKIGMSASGTIVLEKAEDVIAVPIEAVQTANGTKYVVVVLQNGTTQNVTVETGISNDAYVEIKSGLSGGETIQMIQTTSTNQNTKGMMQAEFGNRGQMKEFDPSNGGGMPFGN